MALKVLDDGVILRSEANLVASLAAPWTPDVAEIARKILSRIAAEEEARTTREITAVLAAGAGGSGGASGVLRAQAAPARRRWRIAFTAPKAQAPALADWLVGQGAGEVVVRQHDYVFTSVNPLYERLVAGCSGPIPNDAAGGRGARGHARHHVAAQPRIGGAGAARVALERIGQGGGEQRRLARRQCSCGFVEIMPRRRLGAEQSRRPIRRY